MFIVGLVVGGVAVYFLRDRIKALVDKVKAKFQSVD
jgi:hypothetical protein